MIDDAAADILARFDAGEHFPDVWRGRFDLMDGYRVQLAIAVLRTARGDRRIGWKDGLTAEAIQKMEGFDEPIFACLFASGRLESGAALRHADMRDPAFENELCITLGAPLAGPNVTAAAARAAIATVAPALEIVERRGRLADAPPLGVADNLGQKAFVTGAPIALAAGFVLGEAACDVQVNGISVSQGKGVAVLGDPARSVAWLANKLAAFGRRIEAGEPIMSGSFTVPTALNPGDRVVSRFTPFGEVAATIV